MTEIAGFKRVTRPPRLADMIAQQLLEAILSGQFKEGDLLPTERDLGEQFGVSRAVVREAIRTLCTRGMVETRAGLGVRVVRLDTAPVIEAMGLLLRGSNINFADVHEIRAMLETQIAAVAARSATGEEIQELKDIVARMEGAPDDLELASQLDVEFHRAIARSARNPLYLVLLDSIGQVLLNVRRATLLIPHNPSRVLGQHQRILEGICSHDMEAARSAMQAHLDDVEDAWRREYGDEQTVFE